MFEEAYLRREMCVSEPYSWKEIYRFWFIFLSFKGNFRVQAPGGAYVWRGDLRKVFFSVTGLGAYIWRGLYMEGLIFGILR